MCNFFQVLINSLVGWLCTQYSAVLVYRSFSCVLQSCVQCCLGVQLCAWLHSGVQCCLDVHFCAPQVCTVLFRCTLLCSTAVYSAVWVYTSVLHGCTVLFECTALWATAVCCAVWVYSPVLHSCVLCCSGVKLWALCWSYTPSSKMMTAKSCIIQVGA